MYQVPLERWSASGGSHLGRGLNRALALRLDIDRWVGFQRADMWGNVFQAEAMESGKTQRWERGVILRQLWDQCGQTREHRCKREWKIHLEKDDGKRPGSPWVTSGRHSAFFLLPPSKDHLTFNYVTCNMPHLLWKIRLFKNKEHVSMSPAPRDKYW